MKIDPRPWLGENRWPILVAVLALALVSYLMLPLLDGIVLGVVFAYVGRPVRDLFGDKSKLGSLVATICIVVPISLIVGIGTLEIFNQALWLAGHQSEIVGSAFRAIDQLKIPNLVIEEISESIRSLAGIAASIAASIPVLNLGRSLSMGAINFIISLPICYFLLADGWRLHEAIMEMLPPERVEIDGRYISRIDRMLSGIFLGSIYTAIAGGLVSVIFFYIYGIPRPLAMASIVFLAGTVPFLTWLVFVPIAAYRYLLFGPMDALIFFSIGSILVHIAELVIRPIFVSAKSSIHPLLVMLSFMGGGLVGGISGFFLAPALIGVTMGIYQVLREEAEKTPNSPKRKVVTTDIMEEMEENSVEG
jgi:predicted PurR-regulated permease PerM